MSRQTLVVLLSAAVAFGAGAGSAVLAVQSGATSTLAGRVLHDRTPVGRALVSLTDADGRSAGEALAADDGSFAIEGLRAGRFLVTASKPGWVKTYYGSPRPGRPPGVRVAVGSGSRISIDIPMVPGGVIAGRMVGPDGRGMPRLFPTLLESRVVAGRRVLATVKFTDSVGSFEQMTDDRGEFRLFGLRPGTYYLVVSPATGLAARLTTDAEVRWAREPAESRGLAPAQGRLAGYARMYFPGTTDPGEAEPIVVGPGDVRDGLTFRIGFSDVARVSGVVTRPDGAPAVGGDVTLEPRDSGTVIEGNSRRAASDREGRFAFASVPPGDYRLVARANLTAGGRGGTFDLWGQTELAVRGQDIEAEHLALDTAPSITGRLVFDGTLVKPPADVSTIRLQWLSTQGLVAAMLSVAAQGGQHTAAVSADGSFQVTGLAPGQYVVSAAWPEMRSADGAAGWWLSEVRVGATPQGDRPLALEPQQHLGDVTLTFRDRIGGIEGVLTDPSGQPAPGYFVLAFSTDRAAWSPASRRALPPVRPGTDGRFRISGLPPGEYYLAVVTAADEDDHVDPSFLDVLLPAAVRITIAADETVRQDLRIAGR